MMEIGYLNTSPRTAAVVGFVGGGAIGGWSLVGMYTNIPYGTWDLGRTGVFLVFLGALTVLAAVASSRGCAVRATLRLVAVSASCGAALAFATHVVSTAVFADRIVQVPEFIRDYTYHGFATPALYFEANYAGLVQLQAFSWAIGVIALTGAATILGRTASRLISARAA